MKFSLSLSQLTACCAAPLLLSVLALAPATRPAAAQQARPPAHTVSRPASTPGTEETPKAEDSQEQGFLNAPVVHKLAHAFNLSEPAARQIFLAINFLIIFLAIVIPLTRMMPRILRKRAQTLRHSLEEARKASEEARQRMSAVEARLAGLDREISAYRQQVEQESREDEVRIKASIHEENERILAAAEQEIDAAAAHARRSLRHFAAGLAIEQASSQLNLTPEDDRALIGEFIGQVAGETGNGSGGKK